MTSMGMIPFPFFISDLPRHNELKEKILAEINLMPNLDANDGTVTKSDWKFGKFEDRPYFSLIYEDVDEILTKIFNEYINLEDWKYENVWFQQYTKNDFHDWHRHPKSSYSCIYYVELSDNGPKTMFKHMSKLEPEFVIEVKEGQLLIFPSILTHCSPINQSDDRKTIIAFNIS